MGRHVTTRASLFPQLGAGASAGRSRITEKGPAPLSSVYQNPADSYQAFLNASWEIDLWGKLRRATEAARADLLSTEESRRAVILTLVTSVASAYVNLRDLDMQLDIAKRTAESREESYNLFKLRFQKGVISETELYQAKSEYEQALATLPFLEKTIAQQENVLSVLLGTKSRSNSTGQNGRRICPSCCSCRPAVRSPCKPPRHPPGGTEPDRSQREDRCGQAQYFPAISLTALFGYASADLSSLFMGPAKTWSWAAPLTAPIFTGGAIRGQVKSAEAVQQQALLRYQQSIQASFREVEDALIDQRKSRERLEVQARLLESLRNYVRLARLRFDNGYTSYIEVLDAERSLFTAELLQAETKGVLFQALVNLYKAMGGGWVLEADHLTGTTTDSKKSTHGSEVLHANQ